MLLFSTVHMSMGVMYGRRCASDMIQLSEHTISDMIQLSEHTISDMIQLSEHTISDMSRGRPPHVFGSFLMCIKCCI